MKSVALLMQQFNGGRGVNNIYFLKCAIFLLTIRKSMLTSELLSLTTFVLKKGFFATAKTYATMVKKHQHTLGLKSSKKLLKYSNDR